MIVGVIVDIAFIYGRLLTRMDIWPGGNDLWKHRGYAASNYFGGMWKIPDLFSESLCSALLAPKRRLTFICHS